MPGGKLVVCRVSPASTESITARRGQGARSAAYLEYGRVEQRSHRRCRGARMPREFTRRATRGSGDEGSAHAAVQARPALDLREASPNPVGLLGREGVLEALLPDLALEAYPLG